MSRVHCFSGTVEVARGKRVPTADGRGWTTIPDGRESATIGVEIDVGEIIRQLGTKAINNKSRRARGLGGLVTVKAYDLRKVQP